MKKILIIGKGKVEKINVHDLLKATEQEKQYKTENKMEQIRIKANRQLENQTDQNALDLKQERSF